MKAVDVAHPGQGAPRRRSRSRGRQRKMRDAYVWEADINFGIWLRDRIIIEPVTCEEVMNMVPPYAYDQDPDLA